MFVDRTQIHIKGGNGGNGCVSFHREKFVPNGGPDGGDGGNGGSVIFVGDSSMNTLMDFRYKRVYKAPSGEDGSKRNCTGKKGENLVIKCPVGTLIIEAQSGKLMADISEHGQSVDLIKGGRGGWGNQHFATPTRQAPRYAQQGQIAKEYDVILELKLIADVGLIGFPNVGKSSLLKAATNANPKIANYHFTTLAPNLGVVRGAWGDDFVMADIPGIIEGAHEGSGLGHAFLRHVERTKLLIHVLDAAALEGEDPLEQFHKINEELKRYNADLMNKHQIIAANKMDLTGGNREQFDRIKAALENEGYAVFAVSAATGEGLDALITHAGHQLQGMENIVFEADYTVFEEAEEESGVFEILNPEDHYYVIEGKGIEKVVSYTSIDTEKGMAFFQKYIRDQGIVAALEEKGAIDGDTVRIYDMEFEFYR